MDSSLICTPFSQALVMPTLLTNAVQGNEGGDGGGDGGRDGGGDGGAGGAGGALDSVTGGAAALGASVET